MQNQSSPAPGNTIHLASEKQKQTDRGVAFLLWTQSWGRLIRTLVNDVLHAMLFLLLPFSNLCRVISPCTKQDNKARSLRQLNTLIIGQQKNVPAQTECFISHSWDREIEIEFRGRLKKDGVSAEGRRRSLAAFLSRENPQWCRISR